MSENSHIIFVKISDTAGSIFGESKILRLGMNKKNSSMAWVAAVFELIQLIKSSFARTFFCNDW